MVMILGVVNCGPRGVLWWCGWHDADRSGSYGGRGCAVWWAVYVLRHYARRPRLPGGVQGTVLYEGSDVRTVNGFVLPRNRGLEYCTMHRQNIAEETR